MFYNKFGQCISIEMKLKCVKILDVNLDFEIGKRKKYYPTMMRILKHHTKY